MLEVNVIINVHESNMPSYPPIFKKNGLTFFWNAMLLCGINKDKFVMTVVHL
jgi:hypothetical protein